MNKQRTGDRTMTGPIGGPYCSESGDWWVAVQDAPYLAARRYIKGHVYDMDSRLRYAGRKTVWLCETEGCWPDDDGKTRHDPACRNVPAWHFIEKDFR